jgi:gamma-glutamylcyclotransferase (GGCT)/AIG2-like uncharacterized protein YtfP
MKQYLFSYGTLQPDIAPKEIAGAVRNLRRIGRGRVHGRLYDLGEYPGAILSSTGPVILGQVFELPDDPEILSQLDEYEGFDPAHPEGSLFVRRKYPVTLRGGKKIKCWVYSYNRHPGSAPGLATGDFAKTRSLKTR